MISLNFRYLETLIAESKKDYKQLALDMGLPEKFFTRLKEDGSNLSVGELCILIDYFGINVDELITIDSHDNIRSKISTGRKYFSKYYEYEEKIMNMPSPDVEYYKSSWVSDVRLGQAYMGSPEQFYVEHKNEYKRMLDIFQTMENVLTSIVSSLHCSLQEKKDIRNELIEYLAFGAISSETKGSTRQIKSLANRACVNLIDVMEYKKLLKN